MTTQRTKKPQRARSKQRGQTPHPGHSRAPTRGGIAARTSSRNIHDEPAPGVGLLDAQPSGVPELPPESEARLEAKRGKWADEKRRGQERMTVEVEAQAGSNEDAGVVVTSEDRDREALDRLLEASGFGTVDQLDADDYALMREAKLEALAQLCEELKTNKGQWRLHPSVLANIARQMGQAEKSKLEVIQLKVGKPSDRPRRGVTFRAKIGVAGAPGVKAAAAALEMEVTER